MENNIEILIATFNKTLSEMRDIVKNANVFADVFIRSQCNQNNIIEEKINGFNVTYILAADIGTSKNRNELLKLATKKYVIFADDDLVFNEGASGTIINDFLEHNDSDAIEYSLKFDGDEKDICLPNYKKNKALLTGNHGIISIVFNREKLLNINAKFDERFGPGTDISCGEDTIFRHKYHNKLNNFITSSYVIGKVIQKKSTWYEGKTKKYFNNRSLIYGYNHPYLYFIFILRMKLKNIKNKNMNLFESIKWAKIGKKMIN